jgi:uncharacterized protein (TIGR02145 family)
MKSDRLWVTVTGLLLLSFFNVSGQTCVVGGTNFDMDVPLCDPKTLANDATGWFSPTVDAQLTALCTGKQYYEGVLKGKHVGLQSNLMYSKGTVFTPALWASLLATGNTPPNTSVGGSAIVANPKLIDPRLKEFHNNMFVNVGATHEQPFFSYTVIGLAPGTAVSFTADVYNLLDLESAEQYALANGSVDFSIGGYNYSFTDKVYYGNTSIGINGGTSLIANAVGGAVNPTASTGTIPFGSSAVITITGTANATGTITFYLGRPAGINFAPVGIDNIVVKGTIKPEIGSQKLLPVCPENPVTLYPKQSYPEGTTYSWSVNTEPTQTGITQFFSFTPPAQETYTTTLEVTMPGCAAELNTLQITTKQCCSQVVSGNTIQTADTYIFYDDFGSFPTNNTYQYRDASGNIIAGSVIGEFPYENKPPIAAKTPGFTSSVAYYPGTSDGEHELYAIVPWGPYGTPLFYDHSETNKGGMLFFNLDQGNYMDAVLYQRTVSGMCLGKEIKFGASFSAGNTNPSGTVFSVELQLWGGNVPASPLGTLLKTTGTVDLTEPEWKNFEEQFTWASTQQYATVLVISKEADYAGDLKGTLLLDDIYLSVCTPPDIAISYSLVGPADILHLCTGTSLTLNAVTPPKINQFYLNAGYIFQYTFDDPKTVANPVWTDLGPILTPPNTTFTITDPPTHNAFKFPAGRNRVYFRVVIGDRTYLANNRSEWLTQSALSACRSVSFSAIPVEASLYCPCKTPADIIISPINPSMCPPNGTVTLTTNNQANTTDFDFAWYKGSVAAGNRVAGIATNVNHLDLSLTWTAAGSAVYIIEVRDKNDVSCFKRAQVTVVSHPAPVVEFLASNPTNVCYSAGNITLAVSPTTGGTGTFTGTNGPATNVWTIPASGENFNFKYEFTDDNSCKGEATHAINVTRVEAPGAVSQSVQVIGNVLAPGAVTDITVTIPEGAEGVDWFNVPAIAPIGNGATYITGINNGNVMSYAPFPASLNYITRAYKMVNGEKCYSADATASLTITVAKATTTTALISNQNPSVFGQAVTFTATVTAEAPGGDASDGLVEFREGSIVLGTGTLDASGVATFTTSTLSAGIHSIVAYYLGNADYYYSHSAILLQDVGCPSNFQDHEGHDITVTRLAGMCWTSNMMNRTYTDDEHVPFARAYYSSMYPDSTKTAKTFGLLYDWNSAIRMLNTPYTQGVCPEGWHIPTQEEWTALTIYLASELKSADLWITPGADDYGFSALPAGMYNATMVRFVEMYGKTGYWSCSLSGSQARGFCLSYHCQYIQDELFAITEGLSVRCVKD